MESDITAQNIGHNEWLMERITKAQNNSLNTYVLTKNQG